MRRAILTVALLLMLGLATVTAADQRDITVVNKTGEAIMSLYVSPADSEDWEEDVLGVDVLEHGDSVDVSFAGYEPDQCLFDILATNEDDDAWILPRVNLCEVTEIVITAKYIRAQ